MTSRRLSSSFILLPPRGSRIPSHLLSRDVYRSLKTTHFTSEFAAVKDSLLGARRLAGGDARRVQTTCDP